MMFDVGNMGFMLVASSLVMLMTPGLAFFYGGLVGRKNVLTIMMQSFVSMCVVTILWVLVGFSLCFSPQSMFGFGIIGNFKYAFLYNISFNTPANSASTIPLYLLFVYQMMFAIITPALITGAFADRVDFKAYLIFLVAWLLFVYFPFAHMVWTPNGLLAKAGVLDFAGGIVVHAIAGMAALAAVFYVGRRKTHPSGPHSIPLVALGTGLLWFGWYGFNAGSELAVNSITIIAFINTDLAASVAGAVWLLVDWIKVGKPRFTGLLTGMVAGLATITPAAGYVSPRAALVIGLAAGIVCYIAIEFKNSRKWDDALDVWGVHGVGGVLGTISLGVFANSAINAAVKTNGLFYGQTSFFIIQVVAVVIAVVWAFVFTYVMLYLIDLVMTVRVSEQIEENGLDEGITGEVAYL